MRQDPRAGRDETSSLLNRREYLAAGVAGITATLVGGTAAGDPTGEIPIVIDASDGSCRYLVECDGSLRRDGTGGASEDTLEEGRVEGTLEDDVAVYYLSGDISSLRIDGSAAIEYGRDVATREQAQRKIVEVQSEESIGYEFEADGPVRRLREDGFDAANGGNDGIVTHDDGTRTVTGFTGNDARDGYAVEGSITAFAPFEGAFTLQADGNETSVTDLTGRTPPANEVVISARRGVSYEFTTSGVARKVLDNGDLSAEPGNDAIERHEDGSCTVSGFTGNPGFGDSYEFEGEILDFSPRRDDVELQLNGEQTTLSELLGPAPTDEASSGTSNGASSVGGGDGYARTVSPAAATTTVANRSALTSALRNAANGDVIYVDGDAEIDMGTTEVIVPAGVTLASDRGIDGEPGALLRTNDQPWGMFTVRRGARVTGLRIGGPRWEWVGNVDGELGLDVAGSGVEVDNCEIYGWGYASVRTADDTHVHHCDIHHNSKDGTGYGVSTGGGRNPIIEHNTFSHNRHSVASSSGGYTARYNHVGPGAIGHVFDQHSPGGQIITIHHNTVEVVEHATKDKNVPAVAIRGVPDDVADVHHNWFHNPTEPRSTPSGWTDEAIIQVNTSSWQNVEYHSNHYGADDPGPDIGHPRDS